MEALDGNAIAGDLLDLFGYDLTCVSGTCEHCGRASMVGELVVYARAPGNVARCPHCGAVVMVLVQIAEATHLTMERYRLSEAPAGPPGTPA